MRFIHTSDWHLGRLFFGESLTNEQAHVLDKFVDLVKDYKPGAVVIAGDIYDRSIPPAEAVELLDDVLCRLLIDLRTPVIMIAGNHDSPERVGFGNRLFARQGLYVTGCLTCDSAPVILEDEWGPVYFVPFTYAEPASVRHVFCQESFIDHELAMELMVRQALKNIPAGMRKVAVAHAFIAGGQVSESERLLTVGGTGVIPASIFTPFNYTALGHLHRPQQAGKEVWYSGSLMKYSFAEADHKKSVNLVELNAAGQAQVETHCLAPRRDVRVIEGYFADLLKGPGPGENREDYIAAVVKDDGPVIDAMGRLREVYPNALHIDFAYRRVMAERTMPALERRTLTEMELFRRFAELATGNPLPPEQEQAFAQVLEAIRQEGGGV